MILVSIMAANNEIGTLAPLKEIGQLCKSKGVLFHTDAVQAVGKVPFDVEDLGVDLASVTATSFMAQRGWGNSPYVRRHDPHVRLVPLFDGGGHEQGLAVAHCRFRISSASARLANFAASKERRKRFGYSNCVSACALASRASSTTLP